MKNIISINVAMLCVNILLAQNRVDKPVQIHLNGSGLFLKALGNTLADSEIDQLSVNKWVLPGVSVGYHLNKRLYVGYAFQPSRNLILEESWTFGENTVDGNITLDHNTGTFHTLEARYFPFRFDLYGAIFLTKTTKAKYEMYFDSLNGEMTIGDSQYETDLEADWNFRSLTTVGIGAGFNYVHKSGFSFDLGLGIPLPLQAPLHQDIVFRSPQGVGIGSNDIILATEKIENELFYFPVQFHFNFGYNFYLNTISTQ